MFEDATQSVSINEQLRTQAMETVIKESGGKRINAFEFVKKVASKFMEFQLDAFPRYCEIARWQNKIKWDELKETGKKGRYTESYGWSEKGEFKFDYEIPEDLYLFMINMVYHDFWSEANGKVWRKFMKNICRGDDPMETLLKVKNHYGANSQEGIVSK